MTTSMRDVAFHSGQCIEEWGTSCASTSATFFSVAHHMGPWELRNKLQGIDRQRCSTSPQPLLEVESGQQAQDHEFVGECVVCTCTIHRTCPSTSAQKDSQDARRVAGQACAHHHGDARND